MSTGITAVRRMFDAFASGDVSSVEEYIHDDYLNPDSLERSDAGGPESFAGNAAWLNNVLSGIKFSGLEISEGEGFALARVILVGVVWACRASVVCRKSVVGVPVMAASGPNGLRRVERSCHD
ncbi:MAG: nuclear transport factor 2 family protein [Pseudonocardiaceae bacterium]